VAYCYNFYYGPHDSSIVTIKLSTHKEYIQKINNQYIIVQFTHVTVINDIFLSTWDVCGLDIMSKTL